MYSPDNYFLIFNFRDGYPYTGDPMHLPAIYFDAYQVQLKHL